jgi:hypothetical protein
MTEVQDPFWFDDIKILFNKNRLTEFFPVKDHTLAEKLNSIVRFALYVSIVIFFYHNNPKYLSIVVGAALITVYIYKNRTIEGLENVDKDIFDKKEVTCTRPTLDNPFMNVTMKDYMNIDPETHRIVERAPACNVNDPAVKKEIDSYFNNNLFKDVNDVFGKMNSQRQFFTMPWTTIPNAQDEFAKWLYKSETTCKENQDYCVGYEDIRSKRQIFGNPFDNPLQTKKDQ